LPWPQRSLALAFALALKMKNALNLSIRGGKDGVERRKGRKKREKKEESGVEEDKKVSGKRWPSDMGVTVGPPQQQLGFLSKYIQTFKRYFA